MKLSHAGFSSDGCRVDFLPPQDFSRRRLQPDQFVSTPPVYVPDMSHANDRCRMACWLGAALMKTETMPPPIRPWRILFSVSQTNFVRQRRHFERPPVVRLHHRAIAAAAVDDSARHERPDSA
jgi:hypothetical protein